MSEEKNVKISRGVAIEFDFAVADGASLLFDAAKKCLADYGVDLTPKAEALRLAGASGANGIAELLREREKAGDAEKILADIDAAFRAAVAEKAAQAVTEDFRAFLKALAAKGLKAIVFTRAPVEAVKAAVGPVDESRVVFAADASQSYGSTKSDVWKRLVQDYEMRDVLTVAVTGSGHGVKAALVAGLPAVAVVRDHVAYQDFGGADIAVDGIDAKLVDGILRMLHMA